MEIIKSDIRSSDNHSRMLDSIIEILVKGGIKSTSMDHIASTLHISKRTLYEMFGSKADMVSEALDHIHEKLCGEHERIFLSSENVLEAVWRSFLLQRDFMSRINAVFFRDMDSHFAQARSNSSESKELYLKNMVAMLQKGVEQGFFRKDANLLVQCRMLLIQMESIKRMEELFPTEISILDVYDSVCVGFLRSISSRKGFDALDRLLYGNSGIDVEKKANDLKTNKQ